MTHENGLFCKRQPCTVKEIAAILLIEQALREQCPRNGPLSAVVKASIGWAKTRGEITQQRTKNAPSRNVRRNDEEKNVVPPSSSAAADPKQRRSFQRQIFASHSTHSTQTSVYRPKCEVFNLSSSGLAPVADLNFGMQCPCGGALCRK